MFYSKLRWKIHDLKDEVRSLINKNDFLTGKFTALKHELEITQMAKDELRCDLVMTKEQLTSANEEIKRLWGENDELKKEIEHTQNEVHTWSKSYHLLCGEYDTALKKIESLQLGVIASYDEESTETVEEYRQRRTAFKVLELEGQIEALREENEELRKKGGCPCDKRRKH